jgi:hypothetical protein
MAMVTIELLGGPFDGLQEKHQEQLLGEEVTCVFAGKTLLYSRLDEWEQTTLGVIKFRFVQTGLIGA